MGFLKKVFRKEKKEEQPQPESKKSKTDLETFCADDKEVYEALYETMFLDPRSIKDSIEEAAKKAEEFEKSGDKLNAIIWYKVAGGLAIYQKNVEKVKQFFGKCQELSQENYPILGIPERSIAKAQEYYQKHLKTEEKK